MKRIPIISLFIVMLSPFGLVAQNAKDYNIKIALDSAYLLMGKQTPLHVEITVPSEIEGGYLLIPADTLSEKIEIANIMLPDTVASKNASGRSIINQEIILQSFDSGLYPIGPLRFITPTGDTVLSNPLSLKVVPVNVDSLETIHSFAPVVNVKSKWWDFIPDILLDYWIYLIIVIVILVGSFIAWLLLKKKVNIPFIAKPKPVSPYLLAIESLDNLRDRHLCEKGLEKEYYTDLTDILRRYLEGRFGINAMEMTSSQILSTLKQSSDVSKHHALVKRILEIADFVKFAKVRPMPDDNVAAWNNAKTFVIETRPIEINEESQDNETDESSGNTNVNTNLKER